MVDHKYYGFLLLCILIAGLPCRAQNVIGNPSIINYSKKSYKGGNQNWDIDQDERGVMYFANNNGLLTFDGVYWQTYQLPNGIALRSVMVAKDGNIYVGGQGQIGYFKADAQGRLAYHSLNPLLSPEDNTFTDVWNICEKDNAVFFRINSKIFVLNKGKIEAYASNYWSFLGEAGKDIIAHNANRGLLIFENGKDWKPLPFGDRLPAGAAVRSIIPFGTDSLLIATQQFGFFILDHKGLSSFGTPSIREVATQSIYQALQLPDKNFLVATRLGGCYVIDRKGHLLERITINEGLQSQNTLSVKADREGNIWLGLDNGIDVVNYTDAIKHIFPEKENHNTGFAAAVYHQYLYLGTSAGVYRTPLSMEPDISRNQGRFELVKNSKGEVWGLSVVHNKLFIAHASGAYYVNNGEAVLIDNSIGYWGFQPYGNSKQILAGTYNSISFLEEAGSKIQRSAGLISSESARFVVQHNGVIWIAHPYRGVFRVVRDAQGKLEAKPYTDKERVISNNNNRIFKIAGKLILADDNGIFEYNSNKDKFIRSVYFEKMFGKTLVNYLQEDRYENIWFTQGKKIGVVDKSSGFSRKTYFTELEDKFTFNFEHINVVDSNNVFIAAEKGFFHLNLRSYNNKRKKPVVHIRSVRTRINENDSLLYGGYTDGTESPLIQYSKSGIMLSFSALEYSHPDDVEYSYQLEGFDQQWSAWGEKTEKEFSNLPAGKYTFRVKSRIGGEESAPAVYHFIILPPWYQTWWAIVLYVFAGIGLLWLLLKYQRQRDFKEQQKKLLQQKREHEEKQRTLELRHELEVQENEKKIIQLTADKLQSELDHRNKELASSAMNLVRKIEVMSTLKESLQSYKNMPDTEKSGKEFQKIIKTIDKELDQQQEWEQFAFHFDKVHNNYLQHLKDSYPSLSANDLKLCAYLKLNISTKEIAQLMNISVRGVETARFRLRKKFLLPGDVHLADFLIRFEGPA
ncbi:triple tyrosine motif-containing protein [Niabella yanshanensis]|uniref:Triple tyrosine motif-containing protein n=1 Tax=Niabella yanshanensis TaxID=577386 RepID=A0ABZ0W6V7_9BACT|nr:triple tyrosine motif-containing protein [Niabella yanshanensis]WQD38866.1 triple tyrosine motif-containing protein [Niabella yanshanensis]